MNIKKAIKYTLIAIPLLLLAKFGIEKVIYDSNKIPEINPHPTQKVRMYGQFPLDIRRYYVSAEVSYYATNPECDNVAWLAGARNAQSKYIDDLNATMSNNHYELNIYNDYYKRGICDWKTETINIKITERNTKLSAYNVKFFANENAGFAFMYKLVKINSILNFVCNYENNTSSDYTGYFCKDEEKNILIDGQNAIFFPDSQKELEINFQQMAEPIKTIKQGEK